MKMESERIEEQTKMESDRFFVSFFFFIFFFELGVVRNILKLRGVVWFGTKPCFYRNTVRYYVYHG